MPRLMSFAKTIPQIQDRFKVVTRRLGWRFLVDRPPGTKLWAVAKAMGRQPGEPVAYLDLLEVVSATLEPLNAITAEEVAREGFLGKSPAWFVEMFCDFARCPPDREITRIEFKYTIDHEADGTCYTCGASPRWRGPGTPPGCQLLTGIEEKDEDIILYCDDSGANSGPWDQFRGWPLLTCAWCPAWMRR
jgi:hypothetical protein